MAFASWRDGGANVFVMEPDGSNLRRLTDGPQLDQSPTWSPSGKEVAFASDAGNSVIDVASGAMGVVSMGPPGHWALGGGPRWSPDGATIAFTVQWRGGADIWTMDADGGNRRNLTDNADDPKQEDWLPAWSPDATRMVFTSIRGDGPINADIYSMRRDGSDVHRLTRHPWADVYPAWAPGGDSIAFISTRDNEPGVYKMGVDGDDQRPLQLFERTIRSIDWFVPEVLSVSAVGKRPFTWGWLKGKTLP